jgi:hypothetical protein
MTGSEWAKTTGIARMLAVPRVAADERRLRLFGVACCRQVPDWAGDGRVVRGLAAGEEFADGALSKKDLEKRYAAIHGRYNRILASPAVRNSKVGSAEASFLLACMYALAPSDPRMARHAADRLTNAPEYPRAHPPARRRLFPRLLRDIFGDPFRPAPFPPRWRTDTAVSLARQMYETREFSAMPILADALQDAGCDSDAVLTHCREPGVHVRGCWVVDLVLGKA